MTDLPISDYAFLSDCRSGALVSRAGSVDWWCPDRFDASSVFGRLLDPDAGYWLLAPVTPDRVRPLGSVAGGANRRDRIERAYLPGTLVLRTEHHTEDGSVEVTDVLATAPGVREHRLGQRSPAVLVRVVRGLGGTVRMRLEFVPRPEYGLLMPYVHGEADRIVAVCGPVTLALRGDAPLTAIPDSTAVAEFEVSAGETVGFDCAYAPSYGEEPPAELDRLAAVADTVAAWRSIQEVHRYQGRYPELVRHSALVLQGLTYQKSGAVVAAPTTSLPERIGGTRNYDYRYGWLRDFAFTMNALWVGACPDEANRLFGWLARSTGRINRPPLPIMYGIEGERWLPEQVLDHLAGYRGSRPVRVGNDAWRQRQLDVLGEIMVAAHRLRKQLGEPDDELRETLVGIADKAAETWREPDAGMWEVRGEVRDYLSSKVMCWAALDRAVRLAPRLGDRADPARWAAARDEIRATVLDQGWRPEVGAYTGAFGSTELDASVLVMPIVGFLPATDPRMRATIEAVHDRLGCDGLVRRWSTDPAGFVLCSFWLVECLVLVGEPERATELFERTVARANDVGLFAEQLDLETGVQLGNFPQALSHIGLINAAWRLTKQDTSDLLPDPDEDTS
ncbi:glycoside hydrolase family 15 protein [Micromonospora sp. HM5-17]|uniref:glycoside hydrolase family 15 protein n=1 Tax=Micromonospora sp. HM5-17 TaxID=2487710 RepID=UPI000F49D8F2|nr:glycoside hydrolase family 15 protein [Micromonospora sp. HM5-17]ROT31711.1 glycoside hydrolase family 15 protein [Micromonospora sp. HM5-17]